MPASSHSRQRNNAHARCSHYAPRAPSGPPRLGSGLPIPDADRRLAADERTSRRAGGSCTTDRRDAIQRQRGGASPPTSRERIAGGANLNLAGSCHLFS